MADILFSHGNSVENLLEIVEGMVDGDIQRLTMMGAVEHMFSRAQGLLARTTDPGYDGLNVGTF